MLDQECLGGASVASVKGKYQPVNTKRDDNKAGRKTGRKRERRRDSSARLCGKFEVKSTLKDDNFVFSADIATVVSASEAPIIFSWVIMCGSQLFAVTSLGCHVIKVWSATCFSFYTALYATRGS